MHGEEIDEGLEFLTVDGSFVDQDSLFNPNDYDYSEGQAVYYILDVNLFDNITLNNTGDYIINEQSHTVYYYDGVTIDDISYYALPLTYTEIDYNVKNPIDTITVSDVYLPMGGTTLDLKDYMTFLDSDGNVTTPKSLTYSVSSSSSKYFSIENGNITSTDLNAVSESFEITVTVTSYGDGADKTVTLTVYLTSLKILDSNAESEIEQINILKDETINIYVQKYGEAGTLSLIAKVEDGDGIDASISSTLTTKNGKSVYELTITGTNEGTVILTVLEENGKASEDITINVYDFELDKTVINFGALEDTKTVTLTAGDNYNIDDENNYVNWSSSDTDVVTVEGNGLTADITAVSFGAAIVYCEIIVNDAEITTFEIAVGVTGVSIDDITMTVGETKTVEYSLDSSIVSSLISDVSWSVSDTEIVSIDVSSTTNYASVTALNAGTAEITVTVTLTNSQEYSYTSTITVTE